MSVRAKSCPFERSHTDGPRTYVHRHQWADQMCKTHRQTRCKGCGLWVVWVPKSLR